MADYKDLNLNRETLFQHIQKFLDMQGMKLDGEPKDVGKAKRLTFGRSGEEFAMVDLYLNANGTTTISYKLGKNQAVGEQLADYLKATIDPGEFESVNYVLSGITSDHFEPILAVLIESGDFEHEVARDDERSKLVKLISIAHQDQLVITHHKTTRRLQLQGKPLACYRRVIYLLTDLLDLNGLEQVLCRKDEGSADIVRKEMAEDYLRGCLNSSFDLLPVSVQKLLISSSCVKLASPDLPDYCMLLYPDLRALEGILKELMSECGMEVSSAENGFGNFFERSGGSFRLCEESRDLVDNNELADAFCDGYSFYNKHRHTLFHMEDYADASRMIDTLDKAISLSKDAYSVIESLYVSRQKRL